MALFEPSPPYFHQTRSTADFGDLKIALGMILFTFKVLAGGQPLPYGGEIDMKPQQ